MEQCSLMLLFCLDLREYERYYYHHYYHYNHYFIISSIIYLFICLSIYFASLTGRNNASHCTDSQFFMWVKQTKQKKKKKKETSSAWNARFYFETVGQNGSQFCVAWIKFLSGGLVAFGSGPSSVRPVAFLVPEWPPAPEK